MKTSRPYRVAVGGFRIECSEFTPHRSGRESFELDRGEELLAWYPWITGDMSRLAPERVERFGSIEKIEGLDMVPLVRARALPGGTVTAEFFAEWADEFFERLEAAHADTPIDLLFLDIHGASSVEGNVDAEGWIAQRSREIVGPRAVIAAGMDPHGNVSESLFEACDVLTSYRTAPHIDQPWTNARAVRAGLEILEHPERKLFKARVEVPILLPGEKTSTEVEPGKSLYGGLSRYDGRDDVLDCAIWMSYPWADQARNCGVVVAQGFDEAAVRAAAQETAEAYWACGSDFEFVGPVDTVAGSIAQALTSDAAPFFLSDTGDNPGAGGTDDSTVLLSALLDEYRRQGSAKRVVFASLNDAPAVEACYNAGLGGNVHLRIGAATGGISGAPVEVEGMVCQLFDDGRTGGKSATIALGDFKVIVTERRTQFSTAKQYEAAACPFAEQDIVVVKMGYLEPDLSAAAKGWVMALSPGSVDQDLPRLPRKNIKHPMYPFDALPFDPKLTVHMMERA